MNGLYFFLLCAGQLLTGTGLLAWIGVPMRRRLLLPVALLLGQGIFSALPFVLQLLHLPIAAWTVFPAAALVALFCFGLGKRPWKIVSASRKGSSWRIRMYEYPALGLLALFVFLSAWRCFYQPPAPRDLTSGPEVIAEYAVKEGSLANSVFTVDLTSTNNQFKPPYLTSLQVMYKLAGFPFGQVWLIPLFFCFLIFLYQALNEVLHPLFTGWLLVLFVAIPEMYAYSFMALFDFPNAVYFCLGVYFLVRFFDTERMRELAVAGLFLGLATYIRSETLLLAGLLWLSVLWHQIKNWQSGRRLFTTGWLLLAPPILAYLLSVTVYIRLYLPATYDVSNLLNPDLWNPGKLWERFAAVNTGLIFSERGIAYYGYFFFIFLVLFFTDFIFTDRWNLPARNWVFAVLVVYFGLPLIGHLLPLMDIHNSTKRGMFKIFPLMLFFFGESGLLRHWSQRLRSWESRPKKRVTMV